MRQKSLVALVATLASGSALLGLSGVLYSSERQLPQEFEGLVAVGDSSPADLESSITQELEARDGPSPLDELDLETLSFEGDYGPAAVYLATDKGHQRLCLVVSLVQSQGWEVVHTCRTPNELSQVGLALSLDYPFYGVHGEFRLVQGDEFASLTQSDLIGDHVAVGPLQ